MKNSQSNIQCVEIYKTQKRIRLEEDVTLPDYCSDILRVIRVSAQPMLSSKKAYIRQDTLNVDVAGKVCVNVVYIAPNGAVEGYSFYIDYEDTSRAEVKDIDADSLISFVCPKIENKSCKVQSPRRITFKANLCLDISVKANSVFDSYSGNDTTAECRGYEIKTLKSTASKDNELRAGSEIRLPRSCPPIERILSVCLDVSCDNSSVSDSAVNFWGTAGVSCLYLPDSEGEGEGSLQSFYQPLEIKGALELDVLRSDMIGEVSLTPSEVEFEILPDSLGENRILKLDFSYLAQCGVMEECVINLVDDVYGKGCKIDASTDKITSKSYLGTIRETTAVRERVPLKSGVRKLEGARSDLFYEKVYVENDELYTDVKVVFSAIGVCDEDCVGVNEELDLKIHLNLPSELSDKKDALLLDVVGTVGFVDTLVEGSECVVSFDVITMSGVYKEDSYSYVSAIQTFEQECIADENVFYYPSDEETLWDIGKRFGVSVGELKEQNGITGSEKPLRVMRVKRAI